LFKRTPRRSVPSDSRCASAAPAANARADTAPESW
jgi:hypothetical protein